MRRYPKESCEADTKLAVLLETVWEPGHGHSGKQALSALRVLDATKQDRGSPLRMSAGGFLDILVQFHLEYFGPRAPALPGHSRFALPDAEVFARRVGPELGPAAQRIWPAVGYAIAHGDVAAIPATLNAALVDLAERGRSGDECGQDLDVLWAVNDLLRRATEPLDPFFETASEFVEISFPALHKDSLGRRSPPSQDARGWLCRKLGRRLGASVAFLWPALEASLVDSNLPHPFFARVLVRIAQPILDSLPESPGACAVQMMELLMDWRDHAEEPLHVLAEDFLLRLVAAYAARIPHAPRRGGRGVASRPPLKAAERHGSDGRRLDSLEELFGPEVAPIAQRLWCTVPLLLLEHRLASTPDGAEPPSGFRGERDWRERYYRYATLECAKACDLDLALQYPEIPRGVKAPSQDARPPLSASPAEARAWYQNAVFGKVRAVVRGAAYRFDRDADQLYAETIRILSKRKQVAESYDISVIRRAHPKYFRQAINWAVLDALDNVEFFKPSKRGKDRAPDPRRREADCHGDNGESSQAVDVDASDRQSTTVYKPKPATVRKWVRIGRLSKDHSPADVYATANDGAARMKHRHVDGQLTLREYVKRWNQRHPRQRVSFDTARRIAIRLGIGRSPENGSFVIDSVATSRRKALDDELARVRRYDRKTKKRRRKRAQDQV